MKPKTNLAILELINKIMRRPNKNLCVVTHDGIFHLDEVMCLTMLKFLADQAGIPMLVKRTRDLQVVRNADIVLDVGMEYNPSNFRFDHHQRGGAGKRRRKGDPKDGSKNTGTSYSTVGLFWKKHGEEFVFALLQKFRGADRFSADQIFEIAKRVDRMLIEGICAVDNGEVEKTETNVVLHTFSGIFSALNPQENMFSSPIDLQKVAEAQESMLKLALPFLHSVLVGFVMREADTIQNTPLVMKAIEECKTQQCHPNLLLLEKTSTQAWRYLVQNKPELKIIIQPQMDGTRSWAVNVILDKGNPRMLFPEQWRAMEVEHLRELTDINGITFCHDSGRYAGAVDRDSAIQVAILAISMMESQPEASEAEAAPVKA